MIAGGSSEDGQKIAGGSPEDGRRIAVGWSVVGIRSGYRETRRNHLLLFKDGPLGDSLSLKTAHRGKGTLFLLKRCTGGQTAHRGDSLSLRRIDGLGLDTLKRQP
jgi:hypothetical protein